MSRHTMNTFTEAILHDMRSKLETSRVADLTDEFERARRVANVIEEVTWGKIPVHAWWDDDVVEMYSVMRHANSQRFVRLQLALLWTANRISRLALVPLVGALANVQVLLVAFVVEVAFKIRCDTLSHIVEEKLKRTIYHLEKLVGSFTGRSSRFVSTRFHAERAVLEIIILLFVAEMAFSDVFSWELVKTWIAYRGIVNMLRALTLSERHLFGVRVLFFYSGWGGNQTHRPLGTSVVSCLNALTSVRIAISLINGKTLTAVAQLISVSMNCTFIFLICHGMLGEVETQNKKQALLVTTAVISPWAFVAVLMLGLEEGGLGERPGVSDSDVISCLGRFRGFKHTWARTILNWGVGSIAARKEYWMIVTRFLIMTLVFMFLYQPFVVAIFLVLTFIWQNQPHVLENFTNSMVIGSLALCRMCYEVAPWPIPREPPLSNKDIFERESLVYIDVGKCSSVTELENALSVGEVEAIVESNYDTICQSKSCAVSYKHRPPYDRRLKMDDRQKKQLSRVIAEHEFVFIDSVWSCHIRKTTNDTKWFSGGLLPYLITKRVFIEGDEDPKEREKSWWLHCETKVADSVQAFGNEPIRSWPLCLLYILTSTDISELEMRSGTPAEFMMEAALRTTLSRYAMNKSLSTSIMEGIKWEGNEVYKDVIDGIFSAAQVDISLKDAEARLPWAETGESRPCWLGTASAVHKSWKVLGAVDTEFGNLGAFGGIFTDKDELTLLVGNNILMRLKLERMDTNICHISSTCVEVLRCGRMIPRLTAEASRRSVRERNVKPGLPITRTLPVALGLSSY